MMGRQHVIIGACVAALGASAGAINWTWPEAAIMVTGLIMAGSDWPDIDHRTSSVSRSWGPLTWVLCRLTRFVSSIMYNMTRTDDDQKVRDPHRTLTHTWFGALIAGGIVTAGLVASPWSAIVTGAMLFGIALRPLNRKLQPLGAVVGGLMGYGLWPEIAANPGNWWIWWLAFTFGCLTHVWSDCVTKEGAPLSWPFTIQTQVRAVAEGDGPVARFQRDKATKIRRWHTVGPPQWMRFYTGGQIEVWVVRLVVVLTLFLSYLLVTH